MKRLFLVSAMAIVAAGCSAASEQPAEDAVPAPAAEAAAPASAMAPAAQARTAPSLSAYVGKYPFDAVDGVVFLDHPAVRAALSASGAPADVISFIRENDNVVVPITAQSGGRLLTRGFDPASGGDVNWALLISTDGSRSGVCYSTGVEPNVSGADWYTEGRKAFTLYVMCPGEAEDIRNLGTWPVGAIPS